MWWGRSIKKVLLIIIVISILGAALFWGKASYLPVSWHPKTYSDYPEQLSNTQEGFLSYHHIKATVTKVTDGDTIEISYKKETYKVRLLDIDTPETVKQGIPVQPYGKEASAYMKKSVLHQEITLVFEKQMRDQYGRLLAHVFLEDKTFLNAELIINGYARVEIVTPNTAHSKYFYALQEIAIKEKVGLWKLAEDRRPFIKNNSGKYIPRYMTLQKIS